MEKESTEESTEESTFTYDLAIPILRRKEDDSIWFIIEKGKTSEQKKYIWYFTVSRIRLALSDIREHIKKTRIFEGLEIKYNSNVTVLYIKEEFNQIMDSIQARGVIYTLLRLSDEQKRKGVIAISTGHFAHTLSYFGKKFKIPVTVVMPSSTAHETVDKCRDLSATVIVRGDSMIDVHRIALHNARTRGLVYIDGNDHPDMIIGQATLGIEIFEQMMEFDVIILPTIIDGCGTTAGIAMTVRNSNPNIKIIEVQTDLQNSLIDVRKLTKEPNELDIPIRRSLAYVNFKTIRKGLFDLIIFVRKRDVQKEINLLKKANIKDYHGAIAVAGIRSGRLNDFIIGKRVLIPFFGKTDLSMSFASNEQSLEPRAGPSTSFS